MIEQLSEQLSILFLSIHAIQMGQVEFPTSGGVLFFEDAENVAATFAATVPEPDSASLISVLGSVGVVLIRRR